MAELDVKSETINKGLEIVADSTKKSRNALDENTAKGLNKFFELLKSTPVGIKIDTYIAERPYKLEIAMKEMREKYEKIPEENRVEPSSYIALQTINNLNYSLDEDYLKELFTNILISDMDNRKKNRVKPAYIEMVKQMSKEDVEFLKNLKDKNLNFPLPMLQLRLSFLQGGYIDIENKLIINTNNSEELIAINPIVLNNLLRLNIITIPYGVFLKDYTNLYKETFEKLCKDNPLRFYKRFKTRLR